MKAFNRSQFIVMALGNIIGSGIFLASSVVISVAGAWTPLAYLLGGLIMIMEVDFIIEMSAANPVAGSFKVYAQEIFGNWWGYVIGWMFWSSAVLGMASEVVACALLTRLWTPQIPLWILSVIYALAITLINMNDVKGLSKIELGLASVKIATLAAFILAGIGISLGLPLGGAQENFSPFYTLGKQGFTGFVHSLGTMLLILFAYTGTGIIGIAVAETKDPEKTVPPAAHFVTQLVVAMYTLAAIFLIALVPLSTIDPNTSPFVSLFSIWKIPYAGDIVNFILLTAALSSLNSQVYSSSRMLFSMAQHRQAPQFAAHQNQHGVPTAAVWLSGLVLLLIALLSYVVPETIFVNTISASGFLALVNWMSVCATHYFYRKKILRECPERLKYRSPFYPVLSWLCFAMILIAILSAPLYPDQVPGLYSGGAILLLIGLSYLFVRKPSSVPKD